MVISRGKKKRHDVRAASGLQGPGEIGKRSFGKGGGGKGGGVSVSSNGAIMTNYTYGYQKETLFLKTIVG